MPLYPTWSDLTVRIVLTVLAGAVIGLNRGVHGHAAGLRTTVLVGLAASLAMIQANLLLPVGGHTSGSFGTMDLMRFPLGILTGVGFIGGGTILKRGDLVTGVTTAATLWIVTVVGLCFGGGQIWLGVGGTVLSVLTLSAMKWLEVRIPRRHRGELTVRMNAGDQAVNDSVSNMLGPLGYDVRLVAISADKADRGAMLAKHEIYWKRAEISGPPSDLFALLSQRFNVASLKLIGDNE